MTTEYTQKNPGRLISNNAGYRTFCNTYRVKSVPDCYCVELYSTYDAAANPEEQHSISTMMLTAEQMKAFQQALEIPNVGI